MRCSCDQNKQWQIFITVVDVYQDWAGPCKAMIANFRRMKNEIGDDLLHFSVVCFVIDILPFFAVSSSMKILPFKNHNLHDLMLYL